MPAAAFVGSRHGAAEGGIVLTLRLSSGGQALRPEPLAGLVADLAAAPGIIATEVWQAERAPSALPSREKALRGAPDGEVDLVAVLHAGDPLPLRAPADRLAAAAAGAALSAIGLYRLAYALGR